MSDKKCSKCGSPDHIASGGVANNCLKYLRTQLAAAKDGITDCATHGEGQDIACKQCFAAATTRADEAEKKLLGGPKAGDKLWVQFKDRAFKAEAQRDTFAAMAGRLRLVLNANHAQSQFMGPNAGKRILKQRLKVINESSSIAMSISTSAPLDSWLKERDAKAENLGWLAAAKYMRGLHKASGIPDKRLDALAELLGHELNRRLSEMDKSAALRGEKGGVNHEIAE